MKRLKLSMEPKTKQKKKTRREFHIFTICIVKQFQFSAYRYSCDAQAHCLLLLLLYCKTSFYCARRFGTLRLKEIKLELLSASLLFYFSIYFFYRFESWNEQQRTDSITNEIRKKRKQKRAKTKTRKHAIPFSILSETFAVLLLLTSKAC